MDDNEYMNNTATTTTSTGRKVFAVLALVPAWWTLFGVAEFVTYNLNNTF